MEIDAVQQPRTYPMKKIYSTELFKYRTKYTPTTKIPAWTLVHCTWGSPYWRCEERCSFDVRACKNDELYSIRNSAINRGSDDKFFKSIVDEINKRQAVHPLLIEATLEEINELNERTIKNAVKTKLKGAQQPLHYTHLLNDIQLWRNKYGT